MMHNIFPDDLFIDINGGEQISIEPDAVCTPADLLVKSKLLLYSLSGVDLDDIEHLADHYLRENGKVKVSKMLTSIHFEKDDLQVAVMNFFDKTLKVLFSSLH